MTWEPTNANDVRLVVHRVNRDGEGNVTETPEIGASTSIVVDGFSIDSSGTVDPLHGISNAEALGTSLGNLEHEFSFTVMGEYYELLRDIRRRGQNTEGDPRSTELQIVAHWQGYRTILSGCYVEEKSSSVSDDEAAQHEFSGFAERRDPRENSGGN